MHNLSGFVKRLRDIMRNDAGINGDAQRIEQIAWMLFLKVYDAKEQDWEWDDDDYESILPEACRWQNWAADDHSGKAMTGDTLLNFVNNTLFPTLKTLPVTADQEGHRADDVRRCQQLHEGRRAAASGHQRHRRAGSERLRGEPRLRRHL